MRVASIDSVSFAIEHIDVDEVRPGVDAVVLTEAAAATDYFPAASGCDVDPHLIGVGGSLGEMMSDGERADDDINEVTLALLQCGDGGSERGDEWGIDGAAFFDAEDVDSE